MPCSCEGYEEDDRRREVQKLHTVTKAACDMRTILRKHHLEDELAPGTRHWIAKHDAWDERRIAEEAASGKRAEAKQKALDKLTVDDRRVLGL